MTKRRRHSLEFKHQVVQETCQPGASIAAVALAHRINGNQVHKWRRELLPPITAPKPISNAILPVTIAADESKSSVLTIGAQTHCTGSIDILFSSAKVSVHGAVDVGVLESVLNVLRRR